MHPRNLLNFPSQSQSKRLPGVYLGCLDPKAGVSPSPKNFRRHRHQASSFAPSLKGSQSKLTTESPLGPLTTSFGRKSPDNLDHRIWERGNAPPQKHCGSLIPRPPPPCALNFPAPFALPFSYCSCVPVGVEDHMDDDMSPRFLFPQCTMRPQCRMRRRGQDRSSERQGGLKGWPGLTFRQGR